MPVALGIFAMASVIAVAAIVSHIHLDNFTSLFAVARAVTDVFVEYNNGTCPLAVARTVPYFSITVTTCHFAVARTFTDWATFIPTCPTAIARIVADNFWHAARTSPKSNATIGARCDDFTLLEEERQQRAKKHNEWV